MVAPRPPSSWCWWPVPAPACLAAAARPPPTAATVPTCRRSPRRPSVRPATAGVARPPSRAGSGRPAGPTSTTAWAGSSSSTASMPSTSTRPTSSTPTRQALELLGRRRLAHGPARLQRGAPGHDVERARAGHGPGQRPGHLRPAARPTNPDQFNQAVLNRYVDAPAQHRRPAGSLPHLHDPRHAPGRLQRDVRGRGRADWAVCTNGVPSVDPPGRWSLEYGTKAAGIAFSHFWHNNVRGDLQGQYDQVWGDVAQAFRGQPLGPRLRPLQRAVLDVADPLRRRALRRPARVLLHGDGAHRARRCTAPRRCTARRRDPANGVVPTIEANDPSHLIFDEPDNYASRGLPTYIGPMDFPNLVFNVHVYCGARSPVTGNPTHIAACAAQEEHSLAVRASDRPEMASAAQPSGPAWMVTEFGASSDPQLLAADHRRPRRRARSAGSTGPGSTTAIPRGAPTSRSSWRTGVCARPPYVLSRAYPQAVAGIAAAVLLLAADRRVRHGVRAQPPHPCADADLRADPGALPPRLLRPHDAAPA